MFVLVPLLLTIYIKVNFTVHNIVVITLSVSHYIVTVLCMNFEHAI